MTRTGKVPVLINRGSGPADRGESEGADVAHALAKAGVEADVQVIDGAEIVEASRKAVEAGAQVVVAGGGDGTISAVAQVLAGTKSKLGILPLGTLNHFARDLGIPNTLEEAAALIATGKSRGIDVAEVNGHVFINNSAIGLYPLMVLDREMQQKKLGRSKRLAMLVASARTLARFRHRRLTLTVNEEEAQIDTPLLFVGNNDYRLDLGAPGRRDSLEDGQLSVFVMRKKTRRGLIAASIRALLNRTLDDDMVRLEHVERLRVASRRSHLAVSMDGEVAMIAPPLDYRVRKRALNVIAP
ncbi:diacylglycerol/lipid kinase family protein [Sphingomonas daechungensis]|uniref:diacylglycerol/lipid kinase family protein n=1 Tax=Sphingomonas daechungensis TaxID=1176646 RepID=UPI0037844465